VHKSVLALLRPAIELALGVARQGESDDPPRPAPAPLRPYLSFARLPPAALEATRRAVEADDAFRARVVEVIDRTDVGEAGRLWLERPDGWEAALAELAVGSPATDGQNGREERRQVRRQAVAGEAANRVELRARRAEEELERVRREAAELRRSTHALGAELERTEAQVVSVTQERLQAVRQLKAAEAKLAERALEVRRARDEVETLRGQLAEAEARAVRAEARAAGLAPPTKALPATPAPGRRSVGEAPGELDLARASATVGDASAAAQHLARALNELASLLSPRPTDGAPGRAPDERTIGAASPVDGVRSAPTSPAAMPTNGAAGGTNAGTGSGGTNAGTGSGGTNAGTGSGGAAATGPGDPAVDGADGVNGRRRPARLPHGSVDDTPQAAAHLARLPDVVFLVDGYNVSKTAWPELTLSAQRLRLVNAVAELRVRLGTQAEVVFDGADEGRLATRSLPESVRVWFTPLGIEADDVVLALVEEHPPERNVVVVSSDRRVKDGARRRGASVLSSPTFLTLLR
jgi:predicted RNA-binding protein with PIN domain